jgi:PST family polysaccharide transporter
MGNRGKLTRRVLGGVVWTSLGQVLTLAIRLGSMAVLARLLSPEDYGVFGLGLLCIALPADITRSGFAMSLVQRDEIEHGHIRAAVFVSILAGVAFVPLMALAAEPVGRFFQSDALAKLLPVMALMIPLEAASATARALMRRALRFRVQIAIENASLAFGNYGLAIVLALNGFGFWSLVLGQIANSGLLALLSYIASRHPVRPTFQWRYYRDLLHFSSGFFLGNIANYFGRNLDNLVVGRALGETALGLYGRAFNIFSLPVNAMGQAVAQVLFPAFSRVKSNPERMKQAYLKAVTISGVVIMPASVLLVLCADDIVRVVLGDKWRAASLPLAILALGLYPRFTYKLTENASLASGAVFGIALRQVGYSGLVLVGALAGVRHGLEGVAAGISAAMFLFYLASAGLANSVTGTRWREFVGVHRHGALLALAVGVATGSFRIFWGGDANHPAIMLFATASIAGAVALLAAIAAPRAFLGQETLSLIVHLPARIHRFLPARVARCCPSDV